MNMMRIGASYRKEAADDGDGKARNGHVKGLRGGQAGLLQEIGRVSAQGVAVERLDAVDANDNHGPLEVRPLEAGQVRRLGVDGALVLRRDHHEGNVLVNVEAGVSAGREALDDGAGILQTALADEPPGGFGGEDQQRDEDDGPDPSLCLGE